MTTRRSFFATLAGIGAWLKPKPTTTLSAAPADASTTITVEAARVKIIEFWPLDNPCIYFMETIPRVEFCERYPKWSPDMLASPLAVVANPGDMEEGYATAWQEDGHTFYKVPQFSRDCFALTVPALTDEQVAEFFARVNEMPHEWPRLQSGIVENDHAS